MKSAIETLSDKLEKLHNIRIITIEENQNWESQIKENRYHIAQIDEKINEIVEAIRVLKNVK